MKLIQVYNHLKFDRIAFSKVNSLTWLLHIEGEDILQCWESVNNVGFWIVQKTVYVWS